MKLRRLGQCYKKLQPWQAWRFIKTTHLQSMKTSSSVHSSTPAQWDKRWVRVVRARGSNSLGRAHRSSRTWSSLEKDESKGEEDSSICPENGKLLVPNYGRQLHKRLQSNLLQQGVLKTGHHNTSWLPLKGKKLLLLHSHEAILCNCNLEPGSNLSVDKTIVNCKCT